MQPPRESEAKAPPPHFGPPSGASGSRPEPKERPLSPKEAWASRGEGEGGPAEEVAGSSPHACRREKGQRRAAEKELACDGCVNAKASVEKERNRRALKEEENRFERQLQDYLAAQMRREEEQLQRKRRAQKDFVREEMKEQRLKKESALSAL